MIVFLSMYRSPSIFAQQPQGEVKFLLEQTVAILSVLKLTQYIKKKGLSQK